MAEVGLAQLSVFLAEMELSLRVFAGAPGAETVEEPWPETRKPHGVDTIYFIIARSHGLLTFSHPAIQQSSNPDRHYDTAILVLVLGPRYSRCRERCRRALHNPTRFADPLHLRARTPRRRRLSTVQERSLRLVLLLRPRENIAGARQRFGQIFLLV